MQIVAVALGFLLALGTAAVSLLIVAPAPTPELAHLAIDASEKGFLLIGAALGAAVLALLGMRPGTRGAALLALLFSVAAIVLSLLPIAKALRLASERRIELDFARAITSALGATTSPRPDETVTFATIAGQTLKLDVYAPRNRTTPSRPILMLHGGDWAGGRRGDGAATTNALRERGFTVFDADYRTAPQPAWKIAVGDVKCAISWLKRNPTGTTWNIDPQRLVLMGRQAGGHLALVAAYAPSDPKLPSSCEAAEAEGANTATNAKIDTTVNAVVAFYAPTDLAFASSHPPNRRVYDASAKLTTFIGGSPTSSADLYAALSPTGRVSAESPRTLLIQGGRDQLFDKANLDLLTDKLQSASVRHDALLIPAAQHRFDEAQDGLSAQLAEAVLMRFLEERRL